MMSKREVVSNIIKMAVSVVLLICLHGFIEAHEALPMLMFWIVAEIIAFADGLTIYNIVVYYTRSDSEHIERRQRPVRVSHSICYSADATPAGESQRAVA